MAAHAHCTRVITHPGVGCSTLWHSNRMSDFSSTLRHKYPGWADFHVHSWASMSSISSTFMCISMVRTALWLVEVRVIIWSFSSWVIFFMS
jgi:hypothetical protein